MLNKARKCYMLFYWTLKDHYWHFESVRVHSGKKVIDYFESFGRGGKKVKQWNGQSKDLHLILN